MDGIPLLEKLDTRVCRGSQRRPRHTVTLAMEAAGESVLEFACEREEIFPSPLGITGAAREVYIAMERARIRQSRGGSPRSAKVVGRHVGHTA